ncbi:MAG: IPExxxVDY family protein [Bacteroidales bacterium]|nr:IPExxxVDY family protein [Bacteroidales bacterium]
MAKKLQVSGNILSDEFNLLGIVGHLADYRLSHFINELWETGLRKYENFAIDQDENGFSWYFYFDDNLQVYYYLMANRAETGFLKKELKQFDYLLLIKGTIPEDLLTERINKLRNVQQIVGVFRQDIQKTKNMGVFLEALELHELHEIIIPSKTKKYPYR